MGEDHHLPYYGDVFLMKVARDEYGEHGWALYEDIVPNFLDLLVEGPLEVISTGLGSLRASCSFRNASAQT
jgi:hypothetical protein